MYQGYCLVPYLFIFPMDILDYMLDDYKYKIEELILLDTSRHITSMFMDNTSLFLKDDSKNLNNIIEVLDIYSKASGTKIN